MFVCEHVGQRVLRAATRLASDRTSAPQLPCNHSVSFLQSGHAIGAISYAHAAMRATLAAHATRAESSWCVCFAPKAAALFSLPSPTAPDPPPCLISLRWDATCPPASTPPCATLATLYSALLALLPTRCSRACRSGSYPAYLAPPSRTHLASLPTVAVSYAAPLTNVCMSVCHPRYRELRT